MTLQNCTYATLAYIGKFKFLFSLSTAYIVFFTEHRALLGYKTTLARNIGSFWICRGPVVLRNIGRIQWVL